MLVLFKILLMIECHWVCISVKADDTVVIYA